MKFGSFYLGQSISIQIYELFCFTELKIFTYNGKK